MTAWQRLIARSSLVLGTAWQHLTNQVAGGSTVVDSVSMVITPECVMTVDDQISTVLFPEAPTMSTDNSGTLTDNPSKVFI